MKKAFFVLLKILGTIFYLFVALVIGFGFSSIAGWIIALAGLAYIIMRHYKKKSEKTNEMILNDKVEKSKNVKEKTPSETAKSVINESGKENNSVRLVKAKKDSSVSSNTLNQVHTKVSISELFKAKKFKLELESLKQSQKALEEKKSTIRTR